MSAKSDWTPQSACPTCGNTELNIGRVFEGQAVRVTPKGMYKVAKDGVQCEKCGCLWHELSDDRTGEALVVSVIKPGDIFSEDSIRREGLWMVEATDDDDDFDYEYDERDFTDYYPDEDF